MLAKLFANCELELVNCIDLLSIVPKLSREVLESQNWTPKTGISLYTHTQSAVQNCPSLSNSWDREEARTHQGGGSCYARSRAARPPAREAAPRLCLHRHQPAKKVGIYNPIEAWPRGVAENPRRGGFRFGLPARLQRLRRAQAAGGGAA